MVAELLTAAALFGGHPLGLPLEQCVLARSVPARCGSLAVREDTSGPSGRKIRIFFGVVPALRRNSHAAPIFWLSGGPGGAAASDDARSALTIFSGASRTRDIVLVDQRGVGRSAPLLCPPPTPAEVDPLEYAQRCLASVQRDPRLYTTDPAMDDVDAVRRALGYKRIVLYGGSYGATAAQVYLARHGTHVAAAVLDGGTLLDVPIWERMALNVQGAFDGLAARCAADRVCSVAFPDVPGDLGTVLSRLRSSPLDVQVQGGTESFGLTDAQDTVHSLLRVPDLAARVPLILHRAAAGDLSGLTTPWASTRADGILTARKLMYWAIRCGEGWSRAEPAEVARLGAGTSFLEAAIGDAQSQALACSMLGPPLPAPDTGAVPHRTTPVLFLVGGMDPQDPLANVADARRSLPNAQILVVPGAGHGSVQYGCLPDVAAHFFTTHRLSARDRVCAAKVEPPPFALR
jgi:pimeloyl-ACP methyl ester carboxylesterase